MNLANAQEAVEDFHRLINAPIRRHSSLLPTSKVNAGKAIKILEDAAVKLQKISGEDEMLMRLCMTVEETIEWVEAHHDGDLVASADALGDRAYLLLGDAVSTGMPLDQIFQEVHRSNMTKQSLKQSNDGKGVKSERFERPDLFHILQQNIQPINKQKTGE